jgi:two-component sensor histidine kinase
MIERDPGGVITIHDDPSVLHDGLPRRYLSIIAEAAERLLAADDPAAMVDELFATICDELKLDMYFNYRLDGERLRLEAYGGLSPVRAADAAVLEMGQPICGVAARDRCKMHVTAIQSSHDPVLEFARDVGLDAFACTPLIHGGQLLGTLAFGRRWTGRFDTDELSLLHIVCSHVAIAKHRLRIEMEMRSALERQERLLHELNHRVRNALQLAISIVGMEFAVPQADTPLAAKRRAVARLEAMATAHRPLYATDRLGQVDVEALVRGVAEQTVGHDVAVLVDGVHSLTVERGVALALAIHAILLGNADLKTIRVGSRVMDGMVRLAITLSAGPLAAGSVAAGSPADGGEMPRSIGLLLRQLHAAIDRDPSGTTIHFVNEA